MHPLKQYLLDVEERIQAFAERVGASRQTLYRIIGGLQVPKPMLARRIVEATGGAVTMDMLYGGDRPGSADIIPLNARDDDPQLNQESLKFAIAVVANHLRAPNAPPTPSNLLEIATEAVTNTYTALARLTTHRGQARLAQALRPVLEEILKESGGAPAPSALDRGAQLAAELYLQSDRQQGQR